MLVDPSTSTTSATVTGAIRQASQATGASFDYLLATAQVESGLNPQAGAQTSSARGLFQFIQQTWLATMKQAGPALGYGRYAAAIVKTASGRYEVPDAAMRNEILKLRVDPATNAVMAGAFTRANAAALSARLGRAPSEGELYIAHFLGAGGAARLISIAATDPNAKAADFFANAAQANSSIFYDRATGAARSVAQVRDILTARYDVARGTQEQRAARAANGAAAVEEPAGVRGAGGSAGSSGAAPAAGSAPAAAVPDTAGITDAFAAAMERRAESDGRLFRGLFADGGRAATAVGALWGEATAGAGGARTQSAAARWLDLFRDAKGKGPSGEGAEG
jgi:hypothetical protein